MAKSKEKTLVLFRKWGKEGNAIIALFPLEPSDAQGLFCESYMHVGQHGGATTSLVNETKPATPKEYKALARELRQRGYNLKIGKRVPRTALETRRAKIAEMDKAIQK